MHKTTHISVYNQLFGSVVKLENYNPNNNTVK